MSAASKPIVQIDYDFVHYFKLEKVKVLYKKGDTEVWETVSRSDASVRRAVKQILNVDSDGNITNKRVIATELAVLRKVNHPHVIEMFGAGLCPGYTAFSMPMYPRGSLHRIRGMIGPDDLERCIVQVACAVRYLHSMDIAHGDIKPENIMIDDSNNAILSDFGLSHFLDKGNVIVSEWAGTIGYNGPEHYRYRKKNAYLVSKVTAATITTSQQQQ